MDLWAWSLVNQDRKKEWKFASLLLFAIRTGSKALKKRRANIICRQQIFGISKWQIESDCVPSICLFCIWQKQNKHSTHLMETEQKEYRERNDSSTHQNFFSHIIMNIYEFINLLTVLCIKIEMLLFCVPVYSKLFDFPEHRKKHHISGVELHIICMPNAKDNEKRKEILTIQCYFIRKSSGKNEEKNTDMEREKEWGGEREREGNENEPKKDAWVDFCGRWHVHKMRTTFEIIISIKVHLYGYQSACVRVRMNVFAVFIYGYSRNALHPSEKKKRANERVRARRPKKMMWMCENRSEHTKPSPHVQ